MWQKINCLTKMYNFGDIYVIIYWGCNYNAIFALYCFKGWSELYHSQNLKDSTRNFRNWTHLLLLHLAFYIFLIVFSDWHFHTRKFRHSLSVNFVSLLGPSGKLWMVQKNHLLREKWQVNSSSLYQWNVEEAVFLKHEPIILRWQRLNSFMYLESFLLQR